MRGGNGNASCWCWEDRMPSVALLMVAALVTVTNGKLVDVAGQLEDALQTNQLEETSPGVAQGEGDDLPQVLRRRLMDDNYEYQPDDSDDDALPHQRPQRRYQGSPTSPPASDEERSVTPNTEDRDSDFFPSAERQAPPALSRSGMPLDDITAAATIMPRSRSRYIQQCARRRKDKASSDHSAADGRRAMDWRRVPLPGGEGATPSDASRTVREPLLPSRPPLEPEDSYWAVNHLGEGPANMFEGGELDDMSAEYDGRDAEVSRVNDMLRHQRDIDPGMRRFMQPDPDPVDHANKTIRLIKVPGNARSGRRSMPRAIIQEEGAGGVVLVSMDGSPLPPFRLPADRRQYMHGDDRHSHRRHRLTYHKHH